VIGMPCNLPTFRRVGQSRVRIARGRPGRLFRQFWQTAFSCGFTSEIRARYARTNSSDETFRERMRRAEFRAGTIMRLFLSSGPVFSFFHSRPEQWKAAIFLKGSRQARARPASARNDLRDASRPRSPDIKTLMRFTLLVVTQC